MQPNYFLFELSFSQSNKLTWLCGHKLNRASLALFIVNEYLIFSKSVIDTRIKPH